MTLHHISFLILIVGLILLAWLLPCAPPAPIGQLGKFVRIVTTVAGVVWFVIEVFGAVPLR